MGPQEAAGQRDEAVAEDEVEEPVEEVASRHHGLAKVGEKQWLGRGKMSNQSRSL